MLAKKEFLRLIIESKSYLTKALERQDRLTEWEWIPELTDAASHERNTYRLKTGYNRSEDNYGNLSNLEVVSICKHKRLINSNPGLYLSLFSP